jgi:FemAB-related protein (PEP-CTERM system-associated)
MLRKSDEGRGMKVITIDSEESAWDLFIRSIEDATSYHRLKWRNVITESFGHNCHYLAAIDNNGEWQGVLPLVHMRSRLFGHFLISVPFVNYGGLLCNNDSAAGVLLDEAERLRRSLGATHVELRHAGRRLTGIPSRQHKVTMLLDLAANVDDQWRAFNGKLRNQIRKAEKNGLQSVIGHLEVLDPFYEVFARNMRDLGTPVYAKSFFRNIMKAFPDTTRIFCVYREGRVIAGGIGSWFKDTFEVPWASSISDYNALCPNNMLYWEAIRFAIRNGFKKFDFGRSTPYEGTYNFKKQWGALPVQLNWQYLIDGQNSIPDLNPTNPRYQTAIRIWQCFPLRVTKVLGPMIVRNIP